VPELVAPIPKAAFAAAIAALDEYKTPLLGDAQLGNVRRASVAVVAAAPHIQQRAYAQLVTARPALVMVLQSLAVVALTWGTLLYVAVTASGGLRGAGIVALLANAYAYLSSKRFTRDMRRRASEQLDAAEAGRD